jgi:hypothetical protein
MNSEIVSRLDWRSSEETFGVVTVHAICASDSEAALSKTATASSGEDAPLWHPLNAVRLICVCGLRVCFWSGVRSGAGGPVPGLLWGFVGHFGVGAGWRGCQGTWG